VQLDNLEQGATYLRRWSMYLCLFQKVWSHLKIKGNWWRNI